MICIDFRFFLLSFIILCCLKLELHILFVVLKEIRSTFIGFVIAAVVVFAFNRNVAGWGKFLVFGRFWLGLLVLEPKRL